MALRISGSVGKALKGTVKQRTAKIAMVVARTWQTAVRNSSLSPSAKQRYVSAIQPYKSRPGAYVKDFVAKLLETGWDSFDMKPGLLKGAESRIIPIKGSNGSVEFRRVSKNSPSSSWIHPGFKGAKVFDRVRERLQLLLGEATRE